MKNIACKWLLFAAFTILVSGNCNKDEEPSLFIAIDGFVCTDNLGNQYAVVGNAGKDWQVLAASEFTATELAFLNFSENINMSNTSVCTVSVYPGYPNPHLGQAQFYFNSQDSVKFKLAVVNSSGQVVNTYAGKHKGTQYIAFNFTDNTTYPPGQSLRYYFSFSAASQANFIVGFGDVKKCKVSSFTTTTYTTCF